MGARNLNESWWDRAAVGPGVLREFFWYFCIPDSEDANHLV